MWIGIPARVCVCARRPVRPRVARARALDATVAPPVANACARCASIVVVVVVVDCRRRARVEGVSGVVASRRGPSRVGKQCDDATRGDRFVCVPVRTRGRSVAVGRRDRDDASTRATPRTATRDRDRDACVDAREPAARETTRRSVASRESRARSARRLDSTPPRDARESDARESDGASARRRSAQGEGSRGVVEGSQSGVGFARSDRAKRGTGRRRTTRGRSCGCTFPRVVTRRVRDADPPDSVPDSVRIRGRWRCDGWSPCRSSAKRARA